MQPGPDDVVAHSGHNKDVTSVIPLVPPFHIVVQQMRKACVTSSDNVETTH